METIGNLDLVPTARRVAGPGATYLMAPFTHVSANRPSRFSDGSFGVLYAGSSFEVALFETVHYHGSIDVNSRSSVTGLYKAITAISPRIDGIVNSAGICPGGDG